MKRWIGGLAAVLLLPACGDGTSRHARDPGGTSDGSGAGQLPSVRIISPDSGATFPERATMTLEAAVTDPNASIVRVDFYDDNRRIGGASSPPYLFTYGPLKAGTHLLCAVAVDIDGIPFASSPVTVFVVRGDGDHKDDRKH